MFISIVTEPGCVRPSVESPQEILLTPTDFIKNRPSDLRDAELDLDEVTNAVANLSASRLRLLQDTTMIESALDLDSLEESVSSIDTGSQAGLLKPKEFP